jgi:hypothetical protein
MKSSFLSDKDRSATGAVKQVSHANLITNDVAAAGLRVCTYSLNGEFSKESTADGRL